MGEGMESHRTLNGRKIEICREEKQLKRKPMTFGYNRKTNSDWPVYWQKTIKEVAYLGKGRKNKGQYEISSIVWGGKRGLANGAITK